MATQKVPSWIENNLKKKECCKFIGSTRDLQRCGCGRSLSHHQDLNRTTHITGAAPMSWDTRFHTRMYPTDAYGVLEFQGAGHGNKAKYIRLADNTKSEEILKVLHQDWNLGLPNLLISIKGGLQNFEMQPKLKRVFSKGLRKAARTTGAWIITKGTHTGVTLHVGNALNNHSVKMRDRIVTIGIAPWGVLNDKESLIGKDTTKPYCSVTCPISKGFKLNSHHTHFLLVDNGTTGQYGSEVVLRRRFEKFISQQKISTHRRVPVVCMVVEGGPTTIRTMLANVSGHPPIPVVVFDGTGRAADIIAFTHKYTAEDGTLSDSLSHQLMTTIRQTFNFNQEQTENLFIELMMCMKKKELITVFCLSSEGTEEIDLAILSALLKAQARSYADQLSLALTWDRVDIAKQQIFVHGRDWADGVLEQAMMDALMSDRVDFVQLLKDNGVNMSKFLTAARLEELYNTKLGPPNILQALVKDVKMTTTDPRISLYDIGLIEENLLGGMYQSTYTTKKFKGLYPQAIRRGLSFAAILEKEVSDTASKYTMIFDYPFNELFIWAVLMKRQKMALYMWRQDEEALAKALVGGMLYKAMARAAEAINLDQEIADQLRKYATEFQNLALDLLDQCYMEDDDVTLQLLTVQLNNWSKQTCLSLAASTQHRDFVAHTCCQTLLSDMWLGGLQMQKYINLRVIAALLFPPAIALVSFKTREELQLMPQTLEEHIADLQDSDDEGDGQSISSFNHLQEEDDIETGSPTPDTIGNHHEFNALHSDTIQTSGTVTVHRKQLRMGKKLYEFYNAPISKFWMQSMAFILFLAMFNYVVLIQMEPMPSVEEWIVIAYIITTGIEHIRQLLASEPPTVGQRFRVFYAGYWNIHDALAIVYFILGLSLRLHPLTRSAGRVIYCTDIVFWYLKLLDLLSVNIYLGPFVNMIGKMMRDMCYFIVLLVIVMMSFGVVRQSILFPNEAPSWLILREIFHEPYFMIYGEVYAPKILTPCDGDVPCPPGHWVVPAAMAVYLFVSIILMVSLLIAVFNNTFTAVNPIARQYWKFQRYALTMNYEQKPLLVPPLVIFHHIYWLFRFFVCRCQRFQSVSRLDRGLKLFFNPEEIERLQDFEEGCLELYFREKNKNMESSTDERIRVMYEREAENGYRLQEIVEKENIHKMHLRSMDIRMARLEDVCLRTSRSVQGLHYLFSEGVISTATQSKDSLAEGRSPGGKKLSREDTWEEDTPKNQADEATLEKQTEESPHPVVKRALSESAASMLSRPIDLDLHSQLNADSAGYNGLMSDGKDMSHMKEPVFLLTEADDNSPKARQFDPASSDVKTVGDVSEASDFEYGARERVSTPYADRISFPRLSLRSQEAAIQTTPSASGRASPLKIRSPLRSPLKRKQSTFEKFMAGSTPSSLKEEYNPVKRQVGISGSSSMSQFPSTEKTHLTRLGLGMRTRDSESNLSTYSASSYYTQPVHKSMPYTSAPAYSSIMDHIDTSSMANNWLQDLNSSGTTGYLPMIDNTSNLDLRLDAIPLSPTTSLQVDLAQFTSKMSPMSEVSDGYGRLQLAERSCYDVMKDVIECGSEEGNNSEVSSEHSAGGIEFKVRKRKESKDANAHQNSSWHPNKNTMETEF